MPQLPMIPDREKPPTPANVSWASDTWPAKPVTTTYDRPRIAAMNVPITALRHVPCVTSERDDAERGTRDGGHEERPGPRRPSELLAQ